MTGPEGHGILKAEDMSDENQVVKSNTEILEAFPKAKGSLFGPSKKINTLPQEIEVYEAKERGEIRLAGDELEYVVRHVLIGAVTYGIHAVNKIAIFAGCTVNQAQEILKEHGHKVGTETFCLTKQEIMARLSVLATNGNDGTKLTALKMLMEFRGVGAPEGGSRNFKRTVMKFATGQ